MSTVQEHNKQVYLDLEVGDLVEFNRGLYSHWAVFIGGEEVIHLAGVEDDGLGSVQSKHVFTISGKTFNKAIVRIDKFWDVVGINRVHKNNKDHWKLKAYKPSQIVKRARSKLESKGYNLFYKNCEIFAAWCRFGVERSDQVDRLKIGLAVAFALFAILGIVCLARGSSKKKNRKSPH